MTKLGFRKHWHHNNHRHHHRFKRHNNIDFIIVIIIIFIIVFGAILFFNVDTSESSIDPPIYNQQVEQAIEDKNSDNTEKELTKGPVNPKDIENLIFIYTNEERKNAGISPLKLDSKLSAIARAHSEDMAKNNYFSHTNLIGYGPDERAQKAGYNIRKALGGGAYQIGIAENIGKIPISEVISIFYPINYLTVDANDLARRQVDSWMDSSGHRTNILNSEYNVIGVGVAYDGEIYYISTQDFK